MGLDQERIFYKNGLLKYMRSSKWIIVTSTSMVLALFIFCSSKKFDGSDNFLGKLLFMLNEAHYQSKDIDNKLSEDVFSNLINNIDRDKHFFMQSDIDRLSEYKTEIDDQILLGKFDFFDTTWVILMRQMSQIEPLIVSSLSQPMNYDGDESYTVSDKPQEFHPNWASLSTDWNRWLKFQTLERLSRKIETQKKAKDSSSIAKQKPFDTLELEARNETKKFYTDWFKRLRKMDRKDQIGMYANTISEIYDPHTNYFPPEEKENFDISMTGKLEGIGATLTERDGYVKVEKIVPGSASFRQGQLKAGDLILKVAQAEAEPIDIVDMKLDDAIQLIRGKKGTQVRLTVKKPDASVVVISIIREVVVIEESFARSAIMKFNNKFYGLIYLPSFYADFSQRGRGRNCAGDVKIEIEKLKKSGVSGIVLDLRNNGGGSLADAIEMGGLFIPQGPIVQVKDMRGIEVHTDRDPMVNYSGPLIVLTNTYSASASEILAAALQDYGRAIILGNKSTYGKGTVQTFVPLEEGLITENFPRGYGQLKVTIQKFYRINGGTTQLKGVESDVVLPDVYDGIDLGEKEMDFHLAYDKIPAAAYKPYNTYKEINRKKAIEIAKKRILKNEYYNLVAKRAIELSEVRKKYTYSLNLKKFEVQQGMIRAMDKPLRDYKYHSICDTLMALEEDMKDVNNDATKKAQKLDWLKRYREDAGFDEAVQILNDWVDK
ncbi:MAG: carboxy terminal-processing peptidase [Bacteroidetes bacterium]|nr:carboxy terminal-processing peptidase [Bacteroidota bacterium]